MVKLNNDWDNILADEFEKPYYKELREFLKKEYFFSFSPQLFLLTVYECVGSP